MLRFLLLFLPGAAFALPFLDRTIEWTEQVRFRSGETLLVDRTITHGPDAFFRPGQGGMSGQTLSFHWQGRHFRWAGEEALPNQVPLAVDIVDGAPVLVMPVQGARACHDFGYPHEGLAAWRHQGRKWVRTEVKALPADLAVNLLQSYSLRPERGVVTVEWKREHDMHHWRGPRGERGRDWLVTTAAPTRGDHSCQRIRPAPDPALDAAISDVHRAEQSPGTVVAQRVSFSTTPETVLRADVAANLGAWKNVSWIAQSCRGVVEAAEGRYSHTVTKTSSSSQLRGYLVKLAAGGRLAFRDSGMSIGNIACEGSTIVVVRRNASDRVLVDRFDAAGRIIDANWVQLPGAVEVAAEPKSWPPVWSVQLEGTKLRITLADYAYKGVMNAGGTLRRKAVYEAALPTR